MFSSVPRALSILFYAIAFLTLISGCAEITDELEDELRRETKRIVDELADEVREELKKEIKDRLPIIQPVKPINIEKPTAPVLLSPTPNANVDGSNLALQWQKTPNATSYLLSISRVVDNATIVGKTLVGTSYSISFPNDGYTYQWRVTAHGPGGWGPSSEWRSFRCGSTMKKPVPPTLISPADKSTVGGSSVVFQWAAVEDADLYYLYCLNADTEKVMIKTTLGNVTSYTAQGFANDGSTRYLWRVFAGNNHDWGETSATWSFISGKSPDKTEKISAPVLSVPAANANMPGDAISFEWGSIPAASAYGLTIQRLADNQVIVNIPVKSTTHRQIGFPNDGNQYRWRVAAYNQGGWGPASEWRIFTNGSVSPPPKPVLVAPKSDEKVSTKSISFSWQGSQQAKGYWLVVERLSDKEKIVNEEVKATSITKSGFPDNGTQFRWQVFAHGSGGWSPASGWHTFTSGITSKPASPPSKPEVDIRSPVNGRKLNSGFIPNRYLSDYYYNGKPIHDAHLACDYVSSTGDLNIYAFASGEIVGRRIDENDGYYLVLKHNINGKIIYSMYLHLAKDTWTSENTVSAGEFIATMGNTGIGGKVHLHFAIAEADLWPWWRPIQGYAQNTPSNVDYIIYPNNNVKYYNPERVLETNGAIIR